MSAVIRPCGPEDFFHILEIINDGASAYCGVIPEDCYHKPYMPESDLAREIAAGVRFWGEEGPGGVLLGVMGIQEVKDVTLIRHAYVRTGDRRQGVGGRLLAHLRGMTSRPILIGTWADASWAVRFYRKHGFTLVTGAEKDRLLRAYWTISERQVETSVVLADERWGAAARAGAPARGEP